MKLKDFYDESSAKLYKAVAIFLILTVIFTCGTIAGAFKSPKLVIVKNGGSAGGAAVSTTPQSSSSSLSSSNTESGDVNDEDEKLEYESLFNEKGELI